MARNTTQNTEPTTHDTKDFGSTCYFDQIQTPGCYVANQTGTLFRIPNDGLAPGRSPTIDVVCNDQWVVTKISNDPYMTRTKARILVMQVQAIVE